MLEKASSCGLEVKKKELEGRKRDPYDKMHQSFSGFWRIRGSCPREIPEGASIHKSVFDRMDSPKVKYSPKNLPEESTQVG